MSVGCRAHTWVLSLRLVSFLNILGWPLRTFDQLHATRVTILLRLLDDASLASLWITLFARILKLHVSLKVLVKFNISDSIVSLSPFCLLRVLVEWGTRIALLGANSDALWWWSVSVIIHVSLPMPVILSLIVTHVRYFRMLWHFWILLWLRLLISLMNCIWVLVWITATGRSLLTLLTVICGVRVCASSIGMHTDARATGAQRKGILFIGAWPVAWVAYAICTSRLVLARLLLLYLHNHYLLLV